MSVLWQNEEKAMMQMWLKTLPHIDSIETILPLMHHLIAISAQVVYETSKLNSEIKRKQKSVQLKERKKRICEKNRWPCRIMYEVFGQNSEEKYEMVEVKVLCGPQWGTGSGSMELYLKIRTRGCPVE